MRQGLIGQSEKGWLIGRESKAAIEATALAPKAAHFWHTGNQREWFGLWLRVADKPSEILKRNKMATRNDLPALLRALIGG